MGNQCSQAILGWEAAERTPGATLMVCSLCGGDHGKPMFPGNPWMGSGREDAWGNPNGM